jgi:hypothetical protein
MIHNGKSDNSGVHGKLDKHVDEMLPDFNATCNMMVRANKGYVMTLEHILVRMTMKMITPPIDQAGSCAKYILLQPSSMTNMIWITRRPK